MSLQIAHARFMNGLSSDAERSLKFLAVYCFFEEKMPTGFATRADPHIAQLRNYVSIIRDESHCNDRKIFVTSGAAYLFRGILEDLYEKALWRPRAIRKNLILEIENAEASFTDESLVARLRMRKFIGKVCTTARRYGHH
jgi:hypothetical protein